MPLPQKVIEHLTFTDHLIARINGVISSHSDNSSKYIKVIIFAFRLEGQGGGLNFREKYNFFRVKVRVFCFYK